MEDGQGLISDVVGQVRGCGGVYLGVAERDSTRAQATRLQRSVQLSWVTSPLTTGISDTSTHGT